MVQGRQTDKQGKPVNPVNRKKRGLINIAGLIDKELFGLETKEHVSELKKVIDKNRDALSVITH